MDDFIRDIFMSPGAPSDPYLAAATFLAYAMVAIALTSVTAWIVRRIGRAAAVAAVGYALIWEGGSWRSPEPTGAIAGSMLWR